jgi:predicted adenylyl cyclase CyaB
VKEQLSKPSLAVLEQIRTPQEREGVQTRKEIGLKVDSKDMIQRFLAVLNYKPFIEVQKTRKYYLDPGQNLTICLDTGPLGTYIEIEQMNHDAEESQKVIQELLKNLFAGLEYKIENRSYLEIAQDQQVLRK